MRTSLSIQFLSIHAVFRKNSQNYRFSLHLWDWRPRLGNPGSSTAESMHLTKIRFSRTKWRTFKQHIPPSLIMTFLLTHSKRVPNLTRSNLFLHIYLFLWVFPNPHARHINLFRLFLVARRLQLISDRKCYYGQARKMFRHAGALMTSTLISHFHLPRQKQMENRKISLENRLIAFGPAGEHHNVNKNKTICKHDQ